MIRIKNYILNKNDIKVIENDEDLLTIIFIDGSYREMQGTFDDIEWNYGTTELEELKLDYSAVVTGYKKFEEENKKLKSAMQDTYDSFNDTCGELQQRINKAIKYIREKAILSDKWLETEPLNFVPVGRVDYKALSKKNVEELLKILKEEEK